MWFSVSLLFAGRHSGTDVPHLWEERIILIESNTEAEAEAEAKTLASGDEPGYPVADGDFVQWRFEQVERVFPIEPSILKNGTELFCRFLRNEEVVSILTPFDES